MIKHTVLCVALIAFGCTLYAQHSDGAGWLYVSAQGDIANDLRLEAGEEIRVNFSVADLYQYNTHASLTYKFTKKIKVSGEYRYSIRDNGNTHRFGIGAAYREGFGKLDAAIRTKYQYSTAPDGSEGTAWRNKGTLFYELTKDLELYGSGEIFYTLSNEGDQFDNVRTELGFDYSVNKHNDITVSYIYDREFRVNKPDIMHVFSFAYVYSF